MRCILSHDPSFTTYNVQHTALTENKLHPFIKERKHKTNPFLKSPHALSRSHARAHAYTTVLRKVTAGYCYDRNVNKPWMNKYIRFTFNYKLVCIFFNDSIQNMLICCSLNIWLYITIDIFNWYIIMSIPTYRCQGLLGTSFQNFLGYLW